jgi:hypothetical protein
VPHKLCERREVVEVVAGQTFGTAAVVGLSVASSAETTVGYLTVGQFHKR